MVLQQQRYPHEALPTHRYHVLQVFTPHCVYSVAPDEIVMPQPPLRAVTAHINSTYLLTVDASHYKIEEDEKLEYCQELLPCSKELQESRYSEVLKGRRIALQARVTAREDMLRFLECVKGGKLQVEGCSVDEAVEELVRHGFYSDPEEMVYRCGELDEFWKESYEDGYVGWHQQDCLPHQATSEAPKLVREQGTQYITPSDMGPYRRHWYPDYSYLRQAVIAAKTKSRLLEQLTEELHSYRHHFHHLDSITPKELFADDRETLLECLYEEAQIEQLKVEQQALFQSKLEAKQYHVSSDHLAGVTILKQLPTNFNDFRFCLDIFTYVLTTHAYDLALKMAIKEFCDMRGYYLFRTFLLKMIKKNRREILEVLENSKKMSFSFSDTISAANPVVGGNLFDVPSWQSDDEVGPIPSKQPEVPATSGLPTDTALHHKDKTYGNKGKGFLSRDRKKTSQQHVRSNVQHHRTGTVPRHHRSGPKSGHHRTATKSRHRKTVTSSRHQRTSTISRHHTTVTSSKYRRTVISSRHHRTVISSRYHTTVTSSRYCKTVTSSRTSTIPRHHRPSDTKARRSRTDTTSRHQRTSTSSTHHRTRNVFRHHRTHTTSRKHRPHGTKARHHTTHTTATHHRIHTTARHQKTHTTARHHRTHTTSKKHTSPGNTTRHCKTHTTSRHHRPPGTTSRHHRTGTSSGQHPTSTIPHHMPSTVPEHDIVLERDYKGYKTVHGEGSSGHKKHVVSHPYGNGNDSFFSNTHDDEIKQIFEGSSEDETAAPSSGERISHNKDRGSHAAETDNSECYSITSNDNSDSDQDIVHYGGDDSDVHSTSYNSNKKKKAMILSTSGRVPNSFYEFGDSSSDIISYDTSSDDEDSGSGVSDEKEQPHVALNNGTDTDAMTLAGYMKQNSNNAETVDHHRKS
ncbi:uncharacterized protein LOC123511695 isoform X1 [Portunus trituberculatus]|uniref:uncharacterized protein LOC123511695 isoform X1 n=1 Tax=Portunus trituberculatus TaxID=210409 RepID=UPI001E1CCB65|nr:uncharacterized protein LOC123511695 isoform X1 [Portunus trituberculatus]